MSKVIKTKPGEKYVVTTQSGCNVYADEAGTKLIKHIEAGQFGFMAVSLRTLVDDDAAIVTEDFNGAATAALGGGAGVDWPADAALKSQNNTFTGKNIFNGAVTGSGTLFGVPMVQMFGLSQALYGRSLTIKEQEMLFPDYKNMEVWPGLMYPQGVPFLPKLKYAYVRGTSGYQFNVPGFEDATSLGLKELVYYDPGTSFNFANGGRFCADRNVIILPNYNNASNNGIFIVIAQSSKPCEVFLYAPKAPLLTLHRWWDGININGSRVHFVGTQSWTSLVSRFSADENSFKGAVTFTGLDSSKCTNVSMPGMRLDKESLLSLLLGLPAYDAATMTTVPTCTMYVDPELEGDEEVINAFLSLQTAVEDGGKGWTVAVRGISLTGAATYGLRPTVYCKRWPESSGQYVDADGVRWDVSSGTIALRHGEANEQLGYEAFASVEDALAEWGLVEYVPPIPEGMERPESSEN